MPPDSAAPADSLNLIRLFDFYLAVMFLLSFARRYAVYWDAVALMVRLRGRWPRLVSRLKEHHGVLVTAEVIRPLLLAAALTAIQMLCSRLIFPTANLTVDEARDPVWPLALLVLAAAPMLAVDVYFLVRVGAFDRAGTEKYLDQAEHWLSTWHAPALRVVTLGYVNPRRMVDDEVRKSLTLLGQTVGWTAWWVSVQVGCRVACGLAIWGLWLLAGGTH